MVGQRYHLAAVFHSATSRTLYVNGIDVGTQNTDPGTLSPITNWTLGARAGQKNSNLFSGWLDEVRMFAEPLNATQVASLYMIKPSFTTKHTPIASPNLR